MDLRLTAYVAGVLALSANASAAPMSASAPMRTRAPIQIVEDCIHYSDCSYQWLRCGNGWCRGPWDPFGGGSAPKVELRCTTTVEPCVAGRPAGPSSDCSSRAPCERASGAAE